VKSERDSLIVEPLPPKYDRVYMARDRETDAVYEAHLAPPRCTCQNSSHNEPVFYRTTPAGSALTSTTGSTRRGRRGSRSVSGHTPSVTRSRRTCSRMGTTFGPCRSCSGTRTSARPWCTRMCSIVVRSACGVLSIDSDVGERGWPRTVASNQGSRACGSTGEMVDLQDVGRFKVVARRPH